MATCLRTDGCCRLLLSTKNEKGGGQREMSKVGVSISASLWFAPGRGGSSSCWQSDRQL